MEDSADAAMSELPDVVFLIPETFNFLFLAAACVGMFQGVQVQGPIL
jgi:hypothetical protein